MSKKLPKFPYGKFYPLIDGSRPEDKVPLFPSEYPPDEKNQSYLTELSENFYLLEGCHQRLNVHCPKCQTSMNLLQIEPDTYFFRCPNCKKGQK